MNRSLPSTPTGAPDSLNIRFDDRDPEQAANLLQAVSDDQVVELLSSFTPDQAQAVLDKFSSKRRIRLASRFPANFLHQDWLAEDFEETSVARLMAPPIAMFTPSMTVAQAVEEMRGMLSKGLFSYGYVVDANGILLGALVMRDMLLANSNALLADVMIANPFSLRPEMPLMKAIKKVLDRHYPDYPVVDDANRLVGVVRGEALFKAQAVEISAQAGSMVGVDKEERLKSSWQTSLKLRHPWLQVNLFTAFLAGAVVGLFQQTIDSIVVLAAFLPVLAGQAGNTGCQSLAVTLRGMTLGELRSGAIPRMLFKEAWLGCLNGALVGVTAAVGMYIFATMQGDPRALMLACVVFVAMIGSCLISGVFGGLVPVTLKKLGADPATASSIFVTTVTDVASLSLLLGIATLVLL